MLRFVIGVFMVLHGLVHLLYFGQARRLFEVQPGLLWPDGSWAFSKLLGEGGTRVLASAALVLAAIGFVIAGIGTLAKFTWWMPIVVGSAVFSIVLYVLYWDGVLQKLPDKGGIAILINLGILVGVQIL